MKVYALLTTISGLSFKVIVFIAFIKVIEVGMWTLDYLKILIVEVRNRGLVRSKLTGESFCAQHPLAEVQLE